MPAHYRRLPDTNFYFFCTFACLKTRYKPLKGLLFVNTSDMKAIKRLDTFLLQRFLPVLAMTFFICLFIVMMQFLWRYIEDLVGKGLSIGVVAELFWYAALTMVPTALPLAVLLASLMTFGNLGEKFELTAMKAAGISLFRIMRPLIILMTAIAIGAFFFQNDVLPIAKTKMFTLLLSMRQKSPEVDIPERSFYDEIPGMNLYVERKNRDTGKLYDLIIYDVTRGMDNARIILADSGKISFTEDKSHIFLKLENGELFENFRDNSMGIGSSGYMPFRRESFNNKEVYIAFDANFNRIDEGGIRSQYVGQNVAQLTHSIDSIRLIVDSIGDEYGRELKETPLMGVPRYQYEYAVGKEPHRVRFREVSPRCEIKVDSVFSAPNPSMAKSYINQALAKAKNRRSEFEFKTSVIKQEAKIMNLHDIERQKKFTLSLACLIFFFIGAPLGAIIKKGGIGTPLVISVFIFVVYFIFDNMGYKMARDGRIDVWEGIWLSSFVILPMGIFFTYKAVGDSAVFDFDAYKRVWRRIFGISERRRIALKEVVWEVPDSQALLNDTRLFIADYDARLAVWTKRPFYKRRFSSVCTHGLHERYDNLINSLSYLLDKKLNYLLNQLPLYINRRNYADTRDTLYAIEQRLHDYISEKTGNPEISGSHDNAQSSQNSINSQSSND